MATSFPTGLDALTNPTGVSSLTSPDHAGQHADANDAIESLQAKVGVNSSAVTSSLDYKIANIPATSITTGTVSSARVAGSYTGITGVGTLSAGSIPSSLVTGLATSATTDTTNATNITTGTLNNSRLPAAATTITSVGTLGSLTVTGDVTVDTNTLKVDSTNNCVGIGTSSPASYGSLAVSASISASTTKNMIAMQQSAGVDSATMRIAGYAYTGNARTAIDFVQNGATNFNSQMVFNTSSGADAVERMRITGAGRVGIGTSSPSQTLDVNGVAKATQFLQGTDYHSPYQGFRNHLINGGFDVWQRGTSSASTGVVAADRWYNVASGTTTFSQDASDFPTDVGVMYSNKWTTGAASSFGQIFQAIESSTVRRLRGSTVTLSGYVKRSATWTGQLYFQMYYSTSSDAYSSQTVSIGGTSDQIIPTTSWVRYSTTFTIPSTAVGLKVGIVPTDVQASGTVAYFAGMQLERGSVATPLEQRPVQTELELCQRYFQKSYLQGVTPGTVTDAGAYGFYGSTSGYSVVLGTIQLKVTMRVAPTTITYYRSDAVAIGGSWFTSSSSGTGTPTNFYVGDSSFALYQVTNGAYLVGGMYGQWTASAEL